MKVTGWKDGSRKPLKTRNVVLAGVLSSLCYQWTGYCLGARGLCEGGSDVTEDDDFKGRAGGDQEVEDKGCGV